MKKLNIDNEEMSIFRYHYTILYSVCYWHQSSHSSDTDEFT